MVGADIMVPQRGSHLAVLRRIYLYFVAFFSLTFLQASVRELGYDLGLLWSRPTGNLPFLLEPPATEILRQGSYALVAVFFFTVHWALAQGFTHRTPSELASFWRKLFLLLTVSVALYFSSAYIAELVRWPLLVVWKPADWVALTWNSAVIPLLGLILSGTILWHFVRIICQEREAGAYSRLVGIFTGLWFTATSLFALGLLIASVNEGLYFLLSELVFRLVPLVSRQTPLAYVPETVAAAWVSLAVLIYLGKFRLRVVQGQWLSPITSCHAAWLYVGQLAGIVLISAGMIWLLEDWLPELGHSSGPDLLNFVIYLPIAPVVGLACWYWFQRELKQSTDLHLAGPWTAFLHQAYHYVLAVLGLFWIVNGSAGGIGYLLDRAALGEELQPFDDLWQSVSEMVVAIPLLILTWRKIAFSVTQNQGLNALSFPTWPRRVYLYGVTLVATLSLLFLTGQILYELLQWLVDQSPPDQFESLEWIPVMAVVLLVHLLLLRRDRKTEGQAESLPEDTKAALLQELDQLRIEEARIQNRMAELHRMLQEEGETNWNQGDIAES